MHLRGKRGGSKNRRRSFAAHAALIAKYHTLEKQIARAASKKERVHLQRKQTALGRLGMYQNQSTMGGAVLRRGESSKCVKILRELYPEPHPKLRLLDVGAIAGTAYTKWSSWIDTTSIDLQPRAAHVAQSDFFDWPVPTSNHERFDVVCLSLVINFVGELKKRGTLHVRSLIQATCCCMLTITCAREAMSTLCCLSHA